MVRIMEILVQALVTVWSAPNYCYRPRAEFEMIQRFEQSPEWGNAFAQCVNFNCC